MYTERPLFGGAMSCEIPSAWRDVSDIRPVPSHQEVWHELEGAVLVIEILQRQQIDDLNAAPFFFNDLAENNGIVNSNDAMFRPMTTAPPIQIDGAIACAGVGFQKVAMERGYGVVDQNIVLQHQEHRWTYMELCVLRLPRVDTDLLVTITKPLPNPNEPPGAESALSWSDSFQRIVSSIKIRDWELFG